MIQYYPLLILLSFAPCIQQEKSVYQPGIDVSTFFSCLTSIPDEDAAFSVTLFDDLPVNVNPGYIFDLRTGSTGHCFLGLKKRNGLKSTEEFFVLASSKPYSILGMPVTGKIVDNSGHKY